jgi:hypothetical protein
MLAHSRPRFDSQLMQGFFSSSPLPDWARGPAVSYPFDMEGKAAVEWNWPSRAEVKNGWRYASKLPMCSHGIVFRNSNNFTFPCHPSALCASWVGTASVNKIPHVFSGVEQYQACLACTQLIRCNWCSWIVVARRQSPIVKISKHSLIMEGRKGYYAVTKKSFSTKLLKSSISKGVCFCNR